MLTVELINHSIPQLHLQDSVHKALQLINDFRVTHLPVVTDSKYLGLISEDDLLDAESDKLMIELLQDEFIPVAVNENEHFLKAVNISNQHNFSGSNEIGGLIVLEMERSQFAISEISRLVESNDATILHLNTIVHPETGMLTVTLHVNKKEIATIVSTFERYEYDVLYFWGNEQFENEIHSNYRHLMNYLDI